MKWFRLYSSVLHDPKVQKLSPALFKHWINLLCLASETDDNGRLPDRKAIAFALRVYPSQADKILAELSQATLIELDNDSIFHIHKWESRQSRSDDVARRVRDFRERQNPLDSRDQGYMNGRNVTLHVTGEKRYGNVLEEEGDRDTEEDTDTSVKEKELTFLKKGEVRREGPLASPTEASLDHRPPNLFLKKSLTSQSRDRSDASPEKPPKGKKAMNEEDFDLGALPSRIYERFTKEQIREQYGLARDWCKDKPKAVCSLSFFLRWLDRIKETDMVPEHETEVQRLTRILQKKPNEQGIIDGQTYTNWKMKLQAAQQEEKLQVRSTMSRIGDHLPDPETLHRNGRRPQDG
jgi:hypothetical protein